MIKKLGGGMVHKLGESQHSKSSYAGVELSPLRKQEKNARAKQDIRKIIEILKRIEDEEELEYYFDDCRVQDARLILERVVD